MKILKGDVLTFKPEFADSGDDEFTFVAHSDSYENRVIVATLENPLGECSIFTPTNIVHLDMIATVNGNPFTPEGN